MQSWRRQLVEAQRQYGSLLNQQYRAKELFRVIWSRARDGAGKLQSRLSDE
jgi:hypothetical protein